MSAWDQPMIEAAEAVAAAGKYGAVTVVLTRHMIEDLHPDADGQVLTIDALRGALSSALVVLAEDALRALLGSEAPYACRVRILGPDGESG